MAWGMLICESKTPTCFAKIPYCLDWICFCFFVSCLVLCCGISNSMYLACQQEVLEHMEFETHCVILNHLQPGNYSLWSLGTWDEPLVRHMVSVKPVSQLSNREEDAFFKSSGSHDSVVSLCWDDAQSGSQWLQGCGEHPFPGHVMKLRGGVHVHVCTLWPHSPWHGWWGGRNPTPLG